MCCARGLCVVCARRHKAFGMLVPALITVVFARDRQDRVFRFFVFVFVAAIVSLTRCTPRSLALLVAALLRETDAASTHSPVSFHVHLIDHTEVGTETDDRVCWAGGDCFVEVTFADTETTRFYIDVSYSYRVAVEVAPVKSGVCRTSNDVYRIRAATPNTLDDFKAAAAAHEHYAAADFADEVVIATADSCESQRKASSAGLDVVKRHYFGVAQNDNGFLGACPTGRFRLRVYDNSAVCSYRRPVDGLCYVGAQSCHRLNFGSEARGSDDTMQCCPASRDNVLSSAKCECGGKTHLPPLTIYSPDGNAQLCPKGGYASKPVTHYTKYEHLWLICIDGDGAGRVVERGDSYNYGVRETNGNRDYNVYVLDNDNMRLYLAGSRFSCGYVGCGDAVRGLWAERVPATWDGTLHFVVVCVDDRGCDIDVEVWLAERGASATTTTGSGGTLSRTTTPSPPITASPGTCQTRDYCMTRCGDSSSLNGHGICCADCSKPTSTSVVNGVCRVTCRDLTCTARGDEELAVCADSLNACAVESNGDDECACYFAFARCIDAVGIVACPGKASATKAALCESLDGTPHASCCEATPVPAATLPRSDACADCDCARADCEQRCADGRGAQFTCSSINGAVEQTCSCSAAVSSAAKVSPLSAALVAVVAVSCSRQQ